MAAPSLVLDSGALIAIERGRNRPLARLMAASARTGVRAVTSSACVAQVWREPARQARLARTLAGVIEVDLDATRARACGLLMDRAGTGDVVDAALALLAKDGDTVITSDPRDIQLLLEKAGTRAYIRQI